MCVWTEIRFGGFSSWKRVGFICWNYLKGKGLIYYYMLFSVDSISFTWTCIVSLFRIEALEIVLSWASYLFLCILAIPLVSESIARNDGDADWRIEQPLKQPLEVEVAQCVSQRPHHSWACT